MEEGRYGSPKIMNVGLHCRLSRPGRVAGLAEFVEFAKSYKRDVWICTREQIADFWMENHSPIGAGSPVRGLPSADDDDDDEEEEDDEEEIDEPSEDGDVI